MTTRRAFLVGIGAAALLVPLPSFAQKKIARIAFLANDADSKTSVTYQAFERKLYKLGWIKNDNIEILYESPASEENKKAKRTFEALAADFVRQNVDLILTTGTPSTVAAMKATKTTPIVFGSGQNPVENAVVSSLARPGGNVTGLANLVQELGPKRLEFLKEMLPNMKRVARLYHEDATREVLHSAIVKDDNAAARALGVTLEHIPISKTLGVAADDRVIEQALNDVFTALKARRVDAIYVKADALFVVKRSVVGRTAFDHRLPMMGPDARFADAGALVSYGENIPARYERAADYVDKILKGARPADLPVEQPMLFELVVNLRTAKALGVSVPQPMLVQATRVIQ